MAQTEILEAPPQQLTRRPSGISSNTVAVIGGAAGLYLFSAHSDQIEILRDNWWARGVIVLLLGYYLHRKGNSYANIIIGLGVVLFTRGLQARDAAAKAQQAQAGQAGQTAESKKTDAGAPSAPSVADFVF